MYLTEEFKKRPFLYSFLVKKWSFLSLEEAYLYIESYQVNIFYFDTSLF